MNVPAALSCAVCDKCEVRDYDASGRPNCIYGGPYSGYVMADNNAPRRFDLYWPPISRDEAR